MWWTGDMPLPEPMNRVHRGMRGPFLLLRYDAVASILAIGSAAFFESCAAIGWKDCDLRQVAVVRQGPGLTLGLRPTNERQRYFVTTSLTDWAQEPRISPCGMYTSPVLDALIKNSHFNWHKSIDVWFLHACLIQININVFSATNSECNTILASPFFTHDKVCVVLHETSY